MCAESGNRIYAESKQVCTWCCARPFFSLVETAAQLAYHSGAWLGYGTCHMKSCINSTKTRRANKSSHLAAVFLNASQSVFGCDIKQPPCGGGREQRDWWHHSVHPPPPRGTTETLLGLVSFSPLSLHHLCLQFCLFVISLSPSITLSAGAGSAVDRAISK